MLKFQVQKKGRLICHDRNINLRKSTIYDNSIIPVDRAFEYENSFCLQIGLKISEKLFK